MDARLRALVRRRARFRCEYCHFPERLAEVPFQVDHVIARQHAGSSTARNLALACFRCNSYKGPNLSGVDAQSVRIVRLFHPRRDAWAKHFVWDGPRLVGMTSIGRATITVLRINRPDVVRLRSTLIEEGVSFK